MKALFYIQIVSIFLAITFQSTAQQSLFTEDFNPMDEFTSYPVGNTNSFTSSTFGSFGWVAKAQQLKMSVYRMESGVHTFTDPNSTEIRLNFRHICKVEGSSIAKVQYKLNGGSWINFPSSSYYGSGVYTGSFDKNSYGSDWNSTTTFENIKEEVFVLNGFTVGDQVQVQFIIDNTTTNNTEGWLIDDISVASHKACSMFFSTAQSVCLSSNLAISNLILPQGANASSVVWSVNGAPAGTGTTPTYTFSTAGTYSVVASLPAQGTCDAMSYTQQVIVSNPNQYSISASVGSSCNVYSFTITPATTAGVWSFGDGNFTPGGNTNHSYLQNGTYTAAYYLENYGCPIATTFSITSIPPADFSTQIISECTPSSGVTLTINNFNDTQYNYFWDINGTIQPASSASGTYTGFVGGENIVKLKVLSTGGCQGEMIKAIYFNTVAADFTIPASACQGALCPFQNVVSGVESYTWQVTPPTGAVQNYTGQYPSIPFSLAGVYSIQLMVQSAPCVSNSITKTINVYQEPSPTFTIQKTCGTVTLSMNQGVPSPLASFVVDYGDGTILSTGNFNDALTHTYTTNGVYTISVTQTVGTCSGTSTSAVQINNLAGVAVAGSSVICGNSSVDLTAVLNNQVSGSGSYSYEWFESSAPTTILSTADHLTVITPGIYKVRVTGDASLCFSSTNNVGVKAVTQLNLPEVSSSVITQQAGCDGSTGSAVLTIIPHGNYTINGGISTNATSYTVTGLQQGMNYIVLANASNSSCSFSYDLEMIGSTQTLSVSTTVPFCSDDNGAIVVANVAGAASYNLYGSDGSLLESRTNNGNFDNLSAGNYTLKVVLNNGCVLLQEVFLSGNVLSVTLQNSNLLICETGGSVTAVAQVAFSAGQSTASSTFQWFKQEGTSYVTLSGTASSHVLTQGGHYRVLASNGTCQDAYEFDVILTPAPQVSITSEGQSCPNSPVIVTSTVEAGTYPYSYNWIGVSGTAANVEVSNMTANTTVSVTVTDGNGCQRTSSELILQAQTNTLSLCDPNAVNKSIPNPLQGCDLTVCAQGGTAPYVFEWYLTNQNYSDQSLLIFTYVNDVLTLTNTNTIIATSSYPVAPSDVQTQYTTTNAPVAFNTTYSPALPYTKWLYLGPTSGVVPRMNTDEDPAVPFEVPQTTTGTENILQVSHSGFTTTTSDFENGQYLLHIIDSKGCEVSYDGITIVKPLPAKPFPTDFSFVFASDKLTEDPPIEERDEELIENMSEASMALNNAMQNCMAAVESSTLANFVNCFEIDALSDELTLSYSEFVHNYTLYYYDRSGQLTKTISPEGVEYLSETTIASLKQFRKDGTTLVNGDFQNYFPGHRLKVEYIYNGLGEVIKSRTVDGGEYKMLYDGLGRVRFSQTAQQAQDGVYSYIKYDALGRPFEAGESSETGPVFTDQFVDSYQDPGNTSALVNDMSFPQVRQSVTYTVYNDAANVDYYGREQRYIRNNISYVYKDEDGDLATVNDRYTTYYSYDPHGNVEWMIQESPGLGRNYMAYEYDLISGKMLKVRYNEFRDDRFFHKYEYDAVNRLVAVYTSEDNALWDKDASYEFYKHGALKRTVLGEDHVQGVDNLYTVNGWLKAVNTPHLKRSEDTGKDGKVAAGNWQTENTAEDMYGMLLGYFSGDYQNSNVAFVNYYSNLYNTGGAQNLYNGNISYWANSRLDNMDKTAYVNANIYRYDILDRIKSSKNYESLLTASVPSPTFTNGYMGANAGAFETSYNFDGNGNLLQMTRNDSQGQSMDDFDYNYNVNGAGKIVNNQLHDVNDEELALLNKGDLVGQHNYSYDAIGNLIIDQGEELFDMTADATDNPQKYKVTLNIFWTVTGKVASVKKEVKTQAGVLVGMDETNFTYGTSDERVRKEHKSHFTSNNTPLSPTYAYTPEEIKQTYYVLDATGNQMAMYDKKITAESGGSTYTVEMILKERPIYGSDRIGENVHEVLVASASGVSTTQDITFANLESGVAKKSEYQNWITAAGNQTTIAGGLDQICQCKVKQLEYTTEGAGIPQEGEYIKNPTKEQMTEFLGISHNGLAIAENLSGQTQFYVVLAAKYLGVSDACLVYDVEGNLMKGTEQIINVDVNSKPVIVNLPGTSRYALTTLSTTGKPMYHIIDMDQIGYGGTQQRGEVILANQAAVIDTPPLAGSPLPNTKYGWHATGYEDHINNRAIVYTSRYTAPLAGQHQGLTEIVALEFDVTASAAPQEYIVYQIENCGNSRKGELQISPEGDQLLWYQHGEYLAGFAHQKVDIYTIDLNPDKISAATETIITQQGGNVGRGMLEMEKDNETIVYSQRSLYQDVPQEETSNRHIWRVNKTTPTQIASINPTGPEAMYLYSQIRRGKDGHLYIPNMGSGIQTIHNYDPSNSTMTLQDIDFEGIGDVYESSLPTQVYKLYAPYSLPTEFARTVGEKRYELKDHLGNVRAVITDIKRFFDVNDDKTISAGVDYFVPEVVMYADYDPYGTELDGRKGATVSKYRYGFQGQERDDEMKGSGNSWNYTYRMYDPRIGRFFAVDPLSPKYPWYTPYQFSGNKVIHCIELEGLEEKPLFQLDMGNFSGRGTSMYTFSNTSLTNVGAGFGLNYNRSTSAFAGLSGVFNASLSVEGYGRKNNAGVGGLGTYSSLSLGFRYSRYSAKGCELNFDKSKKVFTFMATLDGFFDASPLSPINNISASGTLMYKGKNRTAQLTFGNDFLAAVMGIGFDGRTGKFNGGTDGGITQLTVFGLYKNNGKSGHLIQLYGNTPHRILAQSGYPAINEGKYLGSGSTIYKFGQNNDVYETDDIYGGYYAQMSYTFFNTYSIKRNGHKPIILKVSYSGGVHGGWVGATGQDFIHTKIFKNPNIPYFRWDRTELKPYLGIKLQYEF